ncbi:hypothetical protein SLEP1_g3654 [Rubroshorea leprosula]|uniref:Uncharacterized protein n=1 Tax=Rubroshorea leprosula TaxID=152421 RepID=A0AAV5HL68_9ROSI|nr:hypothetical protein SLEP1_g3654 [Rubroshorea leprosula]
MPERYSGRQEDGSVRLRGSNPVTWPLLAKAVGLHCLSGKLE